MIFFVLLWNEMINITCGHGSLCSCWVVQSLLLPETDKQTTGVGRKDWFRAGGGSWWCGGLSKHGQDYWGTTEPPAGEPQHHILRQNSKWSRLQYNTAFTIQLSGGIYMMNHEEIFLLFPSFSTLCFSLLFSLCFLSLFHLLMLFFNELCVLPSLFLFTSTSPILLFFFFLFFSSLLPASIPPGFSSFHDSPPVAPLLAFSLFNVHNSVLFRREPWRYLWQPDC